ncbi:hypothetical protein [Halobacillus hunanensis]|uniref:hypothetical protein n=1 Tax=Halobacillus hunanensis TaxID=578214 RepID=UPI0009A7A47B|nr:hypothetical protein [Halobacillus hunanensis]
MSFKVIAWYNERTEITFLQNSGEYRNEVHFETKEDAEAFIQLIKNNGFSRENFRFKIKPYEQNFFIKESGKYREKYKPLL